MTDKKPPSDKAYIKENYVPSVEKKNYTPATPNVQNNYKPTTGQGAGSAPPLPKKK